ncbi:MAG TPA: hypothetical protein VFS19_06615 [Planctomycetota bacterium]|nr:hypothetical protein [Planctomycetota bacterium]
MASPPSDPGEFSLIVAEVDAAMIDEAAGSLADAFRLDPAVALQVLKSAPIVFVRGLTRHEIKAVSAKLVELSKMGIELRVTARPTGKLPKLNWPVRPQFTAADSGGPKISPAFEWEDSAFICPSCGEAFVFKRVGPLPLGSAPSEEPAPTAAGEESPGPSTDSYSVTLSAVADPAKAEKAAELIAKFQGIPVDEARQLTAQPVIAVARNVSRTDAQIILEEFKRYRLFGRMSKGQ